MSTSSLPVKVTARKKAGTPGAGQRALDAGVAVPPLPGSGISGCCEPRATLALQGSPRSVVANGERRASPNSKLTDDEERAKDPAAAAKKDIS